jgi:hypothetical protein
MCDTTIRIRSQQADLSVTLLLLFDIITRANFRFRTAPSLSQSPQFDPRSILMKILAQPSRALDLHASGTIGPDRKNTACSPAAPDIVTYNYRQKASFLLLYRSSSPIRRGDAWSEA